MTLPMKGCVGSMACAWIYPRGTSASVSSVSPGQTARPTSTTATTTCAWITGHALIWLGSTGAIAHPGLRVYTAKKMLMNANQVSPLGFLTSHCLYMHVWLTRASQQFPGNLRNLIWFLLELWCVLIIILLLLFNIYIVLLQSMEVLYNKCIIYKH